MTQGERGRLLALKKAKKKLIARKPYVSQPRVYRIRKAFVSAALPETVDALVSSAGR